MDPNQNNIKATMELQQQQEEEEACPCKMQLVSSLILPMVSRSVIELGILDIIGKVGPRAEISSSEITSQLSQNLDAPVMVDRALHLLASYSVVTCSLKRYEDGRVERFYMKDAILEGGILFYKVYGMLAFDYQAVDPRYNLLFNEAMKGLKGLNSVVDVEGGFAIALRKITSMYPSIRGFNFDLPYVIAKVPSYPDNFFIIYYYHVGGNMFESIPKADAIFMKNCYETLPDGGKVIIVDAVLSKDAETSCVACVGYQIDNLMMMVNPEGKERTEKDLKTLPRKLGSEVLKSFAM
ncbi:hypothetical protein NE237_025363 [Protea cynaroides]|uniref:O-methyltransferase C-terminal domain-containing protein n=1 Tax=Protea cynaroides TaxID=273540 RepID=A0A9Q0H1S0_9MAGN|nr:hypothetical protein NE237_025363 [Protea cynaroides]